MKIFTKIFPTLNFLSPIVDIIVAFIVLNNSSDNDLLKVLCYVYIGYIVYRFIKALYKVLSSKSRILDYTLNNRVIAIKGKQRVGKSSFVCYACSILKGKIFSNIPFKIKGKFTHKLTTEVLSCRESIPEYSTLCIDECNLFYHNLRSKSSQTSDLIFGQAAFEQCVGHFTDGNIFYSATDVDRLPKEIRDNFSCKLQMLEQSSYQYSFIGSALLKFVGSLLGIKRVYTGLRIWKAQHFEKLNEEGYTYDLSGNTLHDSFKFANLLEFASFQSFNSFEYDDRYMKAFYDLLPKHKLVKWTDFKLNFQDFHNLYDSEIIRFFENIIHEQRLKERQNALDCEESDSSENTTISDSSSADESQNASVEG